MACTCRHLSVNTLEWELQSLGACASLGAMGGEFYPLLLLTEVQTLPKCCTRQNTRGKELVGEANTTSQSSIA